MGVLFIYEQKCSAAYGKKQVLFLIRNKIVGHNEDIQSRAM